MKHLIQMQKLALLIVALLAALAISRCNGAATVRMQLTHADAGHGLAGRELMQRMAMRSKARAARLLSSSVSAPVSPGAYPDVIPLTEYLVHLAIGTPPQPVQLTLDTGSDLTWTLCLPCPVCFNQTLPYFDESRSSTLESLFGDSDLCQNLSPKACGNDSSLWPNKTCSYTYSYGDDSVTNGDLNADTFTFASDNEATGGATVPNVAFGCGLNNTGIFTSNETGIAGLARGPLSLPSQLKVDNFSHCFTAIAGSQSGTLLLNLPADLYSNGGNAVQSTPLIENHIFPNWYYLSLKGITVGSTRLAVAESTFALRDDGTGGTIIDSGTSVTSLPAQVNKLVRDEFARQIRLPEANATDFFPCYSSDQPGTKPDVPKLVLHLENATLDLPRENYVFEFEEDGQSIVCLVTDDTGENLKPAAIIGNFQQQNMHVLYDLHNNMLSFLPAQCDKL